MDIIDPHADAEEVHHEYQVELSNAADGVYDIVVVAVAHNEYVDADKTFFDQHLQSKGLLIDLKNIYKGKFTNFANWTL